jgi:DNA-binding MarR family transcriptional regulator
MMEPRWLDDAEARAWRGYRRMRALLDLRLSRDLAEEAGLSDADYDVLSNLSDGDRQWRVNQLAEHMLWSTSRLSHQLSRMRGRGLIDRQECPGDGRGALVTLTALGSATIRAAAPGHVASVRRNFIDLLTRDEIATLGGLAETVIDRLGAEDPGPARTRS